MEVSILRSNSPNRHPLDPAWDGHANAPGVPRAHHGLALGWRFPGKEHGRQDGVRAVYDPAVHAERWQSGMCRAQHGARRCVVVHVLWNYVSCKSPSLLEMLRDLPLQQQAEEDRRAAALGRH